MHLHSKLKRKNEIFIVDYIKHVIKNPKANCHQKFRGLLLLKELIKTKNKPLVIYNAQKLLHRQVGLALLGNECLKKYTKNFNRQISADFHHLNLECIQRWRQTFDKYDRKYVSEYDKLKPEQKRDLPVKFYNQPEEIHEEEMIFEQQNVNAMDNNTIQLESLKQQVEEVQIIRDEFTRALVNQKKNKIKSSEIEQKFQHYKEQLSQLKGNLQDGQKERIVNQDLQLRENHEKEIFFFSDLEQNYKRLDDEDHSSQQKFYEEFRDLNRQYFEKDINIQPHLERIVAQQVKDNYSDKGFSGDQEEGEIKMHNQYDYDYPQDAFEPEVELKYNDVHKSLENDNEYVDPETMQKNQDLMKEVEELDRKKREIQRNLQRLEEVQKENLTPSKKNYRNGLERGDNEGLIQILKNKDKQIDDIQEKIKRLEREHDKLNEPDLEFDLEIPRKNREYQTPRKSRKSFREGRSNFKSNRSQSQLRSSRMHTKSIEKSLNRNAQNKKYEQSGTQFVNKMFNDIDRLINKNNHRLKRTNYQKIQKQFQNF